MAHTSILKEHYEIESRHGILYTGGKIAWTADGATLLCTAGDVINVVDVATGTLRGTLGTSENEAADAVLSFAANDEGTIVISAHRSGLIKQWDVSEGAVAQSWRSIHRGPISTLALTKSADVLVTGGTDGFVRLWNLTHRACTHALKGAKGVVSVIELSEENEGGWVFASADDLSIHCWDLTTGHHLMELKGHYSRVTGLTLLSDGLYLVSAGLDKVLMLWDLKTGQCNKTVAAYQDLAGVVGLPKKFELQGQGQLPSGLYVATAGLRGSVSIYEMQSGREIFQQSSSVVKGREEEGTMVISQIMFNKLTNSISVVTTDHNIVIYDVETFTSRKQLVGFSDEVLDLVIVGAEDTHIAVATNSSDIKLYKLADLGCCLLSGHTDIVLSLAVAPADRRVMVSAGKDCSVRLWELDVELDTMECVSVCSGHTASVSATTFFTLTAQQFVSASADTTLKLWCRDGNELSTRRTEVAHSKDINCVEVSPNDRIVASASQDKTIKLWEADTLALVGVLTGHRRGVWCIRFSPVDQILASSSADCTIKLWAVAELTCLKTFEGHESSVLRIAFLSRGMQIISCSGDGLMKLWTIKTSECSASFDGHIGKVWAMSVSQNEERIVTGGSDSLMLLWRNATESRKKEAQDARHAILLQEQQLSNLMHADKLHDALSLALTLDRPFTVLNIIRDLTRKDADLGLEQAVSRLSDEQKEQLLKCAASWNCNGKHCAHAQAIIALLVDKLAAGELAMPGLSKYVEEVLPYTERHFHRLSTALQGLHLVQFTLRKMNPALSELII